MIFPSPIDIFRIERIFVINPKHQIKFLLIISSQNMLTTNIFHRFHFYCLTRNKSIQKQKISFILYFLMNNLPCLTFQSAMQPTSIYFFSFLGTILVRNLLACFSVTVEHRSKQHVHQSNVSCSGNKAQHFIRLSIQLAPIWYCIGAFLETKTANFLDDISS